MPMDEELKAEIAAIKNKILTLENAMQGLGAEEMSGLKAQVAELKKDLSDLVGKKKDKPGDPPPPAIPAKDPLAEFIGD